MVACQLDRANRKGGAAVAALAPRSFHRKGGGLGTSAAIKHACTPGAGQAQPRIVSSVGSLATSSWRELAFKPAGVNPD